MVWGDGDEVTAAILEAVPTRKRKHMAAARADDTDDGATTPPSRKRLRNNRSHSHVGRAARRAALHAGQAGHCQYVVHPDTQGDTTDDQEPPLAHSPDTGDEPAALHG